VKVLLHIYPEGSLPGWSAGPVRVGLGKGVVGYSFLTPDKARAHVFDLEDPKGIEDYNETMRVALCASAQLVLEYA